MKLNFVKMHGAGNDYIYFDCFKQTVDNPEKLAIALSDRHFGIGGDGIVLILPSQKADATMRMFNADGSEGKMCGNAIRCVAKFLFENGYVNSETVTIQTLSGIKTLKLRLQNQKVESVTVDMGAPILNGLDIPTTIDKPQVVAHPIEIEGVEFKITCVSMGNPHCVVFVDDTDAIPLEQIGPKFEHAPFFPERVNTEFVQILGENALKMRVWERGSGETLACGTGACAAAVAAVLNGIASKNDEISVALRGGELNITVTDQTVFLRGGATTVFCGEIEI